jgi:zeta-carotene desaturase
MDHERQGPISRERFWGPLCRAIMNLQPEEAAMAEFGEALRRSLFGSRSDSALAFPAKPLWEIAFPQAENYLREKGSFLFLGDGARQLRLASGPFEVVTASGKVLSGDALILALPARSLESLWATSDLTPPLSSERLGHSPILSVNFILDRPVMEGHWAGLPGARFEWVFNRNANWGYPGPGQYLSLVSSADRELAAQPVKELVVLALEELQRHFPQARQASRLHSKVVKEMAATFRLTPGNSALRPSCATAFPDVFLAGDFTATGLPATIEGACASGHRAASLTLNFLRSGKGAIPS